MKVVNKSNVELIDYMGTDLTVVNAARVSFDKEHKEFASNDTGLISYLARHNHWSPFAHTSIQLRVSAPIFVARQLVKHQVGGVWNEVSRRYVDDEPVFYFPNKWRKRAENVKQGSSDEEIKFIIARDPYADGVDYSGDQGSYAEYLVEGSLIAYKCMLNNGVAPEQARMILPQNMMTSWYWTGSLMFFHRVYKQRTDGHAQVESQDVAKQIGDICSTLFPVSWSALNGS